MYEVFTCTIDWFSNVDHTTTVEVPEQKIFIAGAILLARAHRTVPNLLVRRAHCAHIYFLFIHEEIVAECGLDKYKSWHIRGELKISTLWILQVQSFNGLLCKMVTRVEPLANSSNLYPSHTKKFKTHLEYYEYDTVTDYSTVCTRIYECNRS